ncbi:hypothetical protein O1611_g8571 [Lasiodiplodia mahajangana]|uniref:Uncharacterized protein n=1 Tax=Lasiodiplodia mahajangana TaxID=1108764 RepID=A0ACC2JCC4_9PEZI|nr:hypothetical protein O1611_g8571 [Lasiodiplodia mahajangana]
MPSYHRFRKPRFVKRLSRRPLNFAAVAPTPVDSVSSSEGRIPSTETYIETVETEPVIDARVTGSVDNDKSPIWTRSMQRFAIERPELYELMKDRIATRGVESIASWDTWLSDRGNQPDNIWLRRCKAYLPSFKAVKSGAVALSDVDPHGLARLITAGVFLAVELFFESVDPTARDKAMSIMLKVKGLIGKWTDAEVDLQGLRDRFPENDKNRERITLIEKGLSGLYFECLDLISAIYKSGKTRRSRAGVTLASKPTEWDRAYQNLNDTNAECSEWKTRVELEVKKNEANISILDWIRPRSEDPEPGHQSVKEVTGINKAESTAGNWFLETEEFTSWLGKICHKQAASQLFWLKGSSKCTSDAFDGEVAKYASVGTGKTTLMCRILSKFEEQPISGIRFVPYYCYASRTSKESKAPNHETIVRALCRRLAWNGDGSVAKPARELFNKRMEADASFTVSSTWEPLLEDLIASSKATIIFIIDALDECDGMGQYNQFLRFLGGLPKTEKGPYFLISSRPHVQVGHYFDAPILFDVVNQKADQDMKKFITDEINSKNNKTWGKSVFFQNDSTCRRRLEEALYKTAGGMFRWVEIWLGIFFPANQKPIRQQTYAERLLADLEQLETLGILAKLDGDQKNDSMEQPKNQLGEAYRRLWDLNGDEQYKDLQVSVFRIVMGALEALSPQQLLEAVCLAHPDASLELDELECLYSNFLKADDRGNLNFEHHSAKIFVSKIPEDSGVELMFSESKCHRLFADLVIKAIEQPKHPIWTRHGIDLVDWRPTLRALVLAQENIDVWNEQWSIVRTINSAHFAKYLMGCWIDHCRSRRGDARFVRSIISLFQSAGNSLEGLILTTACTRLPGTPHLWPSMEHAGNAVILSSPRDGESRATINISLLLLMITLDFSPFTGDHGSRTVFLPGFDIDDIINVSNHKGLTALHIACAVRSTAIVTDLLKFAWDKRGSCADILEARDHSGNTPMYYASTEDVIKTLLEFESKETPNRTTNNGPLVSKLLNPSGDISRVNLISKIIGHCTDAFLEWMFTRYTLGKGESLGHGLIEAARQGKEKAVRVLVKNGVDINFYSRHSGTPLYAAVRSGNFRLVEFLLSNGASFGLWPENYEAPLHVLGIRFETPLQLAARYGHIDIAQLLLEQGHDINDCGRSYGTALAAAASGGQTDMIKFLLEHGANINAYGGDYGTALAAAAYYGRTKIGGRYGTALMAAASQGETGTVRFLLEQGADINTP